MFGTAISDNMSIARFDGEFWTNPEVVSSRSLSLHPGAHALHYGSACFEGLKAHRGVDGRIRLFRPLDHARRLKESAASMLLPPPPVTLVTELIDLAVAANSEDVRVAPASLYVRPTLLGTMVDIGAASRPSVEAVLYVLTSPVGDYFSGGLRPLTLLVETEVPRTVPHFGMVKAGANYALALRSTLEARKAVAADQVLFCPNGIVEETGASNFFYFDGSTVVTPSPTPAFLHGVTRDTVICLARARGFTVDERHLPTAELLARARRSRAEAWLSGTGAGLAPVGTLVSGGQRVPVGTSEIGPTVTVLRQDLAAMQRGAAGDPYGWLRVVEA
ncbi:branched-chain-amino-acid transaminase [Nocardioides sp.]|uniref:branched-chain-amino-acid transaminase n=1 Tax=Nocardioides sp. TaxID=35761 RepID=UPI00378325EB